MNYRVHTVDSAPPAARDTLGKIGERYGFVPNLAALIAESPAVLNGLLAFTGAFDAPEMTLSPVERQVVMVTASVRNRCVYCTAAHGMLAAMSGLDRAEVDVLQNGGSLSDGRLEALRLFTDAVVVKRGRVSAAEIDAFLAVGFTRAQVLEVVMGVAIKTLTNYANHVVDAAVNEQFVAFLPGWADAA